MEAEKPVFFFPVKPSLVWCEKALTGYWSVGCYDPIMWNLNHSLSGPGRTRRCLALLNSQRFSKDPQYIILDAFMFSSNEWNSPLPTFTLSGTNVFKEALYIWFYDRVNWSYYVLWFVSCEKSDIEVLKCQSGFVLILVWSWDGQSWNQWNVVYGGLLIGAGIEPKGLTLIVPPIAQNINQSRI